MATNRIISRAVARASSSYVSRSSIAQYTTSRRIASAQPINATRRAHIPRPSPQQQQQRRLLSSTSKPTESKIYDYEKIKSLTTHPTPKTLLIDVREPHEYAAGYIPTALNIPIQSQPDALFLSPAEFEDRFGFSKPGTDVELVFYCKAGVRSRAAAVLAGRAGWGVVGEFPGSWGEWVGRGGGV